MKPVDELTRAKNLLSQALSVALNSLPRDKSVQEAKVHMKKAMSGLDSAIKTQTKRKPALENQYQTWWSKVTAGTAKQAFGNTSAESCAKSLSMLNAMGQKTSQELDELEKKSKQLDESDEIFNE